MKRIVFLVALSLIAPVATVVSNPNAAYAQDVRQRIALSGPAIGGVQPEGKADYRVSGSKRKLSGRSPGQPRQRNRLTVLVNGSAIGMITLAGRVGEIELETERGQAVPMVAAGTTVVVKTSAGATIVSGKF